MEAASVRAYPMPLPRGLFRPMFQFLLDMHGEHVGHAVTMGYLATKKSKGTQWS